MRSHVQGERPAAYFTELSDDPALVADMRALYGDVEEVDLMVGLFAERKPPGFAFSDTALPMASRRLNCDHIFFTDDFTEQTYTRLGLHWIEHTIMSAVLLRHVPTLRPMLADKPNTFQPWRRA